MLGEKELFFDRQNQAFDSNFQQEQKQYTIIFGNLDQIGQEVLKNLVLAGFKVNVSQILNQEKSKLLIFQQEVQQIESQQKEEQKEKDENQQSIKMNDVLKQLNPYYDPEAVQNQTTLNEKTIFIKQVFDISDFQPKDKNKDNVISLYYFVKEKRFYIFLYTPYNQYNEQTKSRLIKLKIFEKEIEQNLQQNKDLSLQQMPIYQASIFGSLLNQIIISVIQTQQLAFNFAMYDLSPQTEPLLSYNKLIYHFIEQQIQTNLFIKNQKIFIMIFKQSSQDYNEKFDKQKVDHISQRLSQSYNKQANSFKSRFSTVIQKEQPNELELACYQSLKTPELSESFNVGPRWKSLWFKTGAQGLQNKLIIK